MPPPALAVDGGHHVTITCQQRLGGTHLRADRQFAFRNTVAAVFGKFRGRIVLFRTTCTEGALVHLAARSEIARLRELRCAERTGIEAVAAANAQVLRVKHHAFFVLVEAVDRAHRHAGCVRTVHAGHGDRPFAGLAIIDGHHPAAVDAPGHLMLVLASRHTGIALNATLSVTKELSPRLSSAIASPPYAAEILQRVALVSCIWVTES